MKTLKINFSVFDKFIPSPSPIDLDLDNESQSFNKLGLNTS